MAFAATKQEVGTIFGNKRAELWTFTELGADTGGTFTHGLTSSTVAFVAVNGNFACSVSVAAATKIVTVGNAAGPTAGSVLLIGY